MDHMNVNFVDFHTGEIRQLRYEPNQKAVPFYAKYLRKLNRIRKEWEGPIVIEFELFDATQLEGLRTVQFDASEDPNKGRKLANSFLRAYLGAGSPK